MRPHPNLVTTVKEYVAHEPETFHNVTEPRNMALGVGIVKERGQAESVLTGAPKSLFAEAEAYPELKADKNFMMLPAELAGTESKIALARQFHNDSVMSFSTAIQKFPANMLVRISGFTEREYFEIDTEARGPVKVQF